MTVEELAGMVIEACEQEVEHMLTDAFAHGLYGIPPSTQDVDVVLSLAGADPIQRVARRLAAIVEFEPQIQFDTLTRGKRQVGQTFTNPPFKVELFELFGDPFVQAQFQRKRWLFSTQIQRHAWLPTPEDVLVQGPETLDMEYVGRWCASHGTTGRLQAALGGIPPLD